MLRWPRALRSKWLAVALLVAYLCAYEAWDLWDSPLATAVIVLGYSLYQVKKEPSGLQIDVGPNGIRIENK